MPASSTPSFHVFVHPPTRMNCVKIGSPPPREAPESPHHAISPDLWGWRTAVALPRQLGNAGTKASALFGAQSLLIAGESSRVSSQKVFVFGFRFSRGCPMGLRRGRGRTRGVRPRL